MYSNLKASFASVQVSSLREGVRVVEFVLLTNVRQHHQHLLVETVEVYWQFCYGCHEITSRNDSLAKWVHRGFEDRKTIAAEFVAYGVQQGEVANFRVLVSQVVVDEAVGGFRNMNDGQHFGGGENVAVVYDESLARRMRQKRALPRIQIRPIGLQLQIRRRRFFTFSISTFICHRRHGFVRRGYNRRSRGSCNGFLLTLCSTFVFGEWNRARGTRVRRLLFVPVSRRAIGRYDRRLTLWPSASR